MKTILILNGPNIDLLGEREPNHYGTHTWEAIEAALRKTLPAGISLVVEQRDGEEQLVSVLKTQGSQSNFLIINPASYTHTSIVLRDTLLAIKKPFIEVHFSNLYLRARTENFRSRSTTADLAQGVIMGLGAKGYEYALRAAVEYTNNV